MTKTKQKQESYSGGGPLPSDDPIYSSGRMMLRPIHGRKPELADEPTVSAESSDSTSTDQKSSGSGN